MILALFSFDPCWSVHRLIDDFLLSETRLSELVVLTGELIEFEDLALGFGLILMTCLCSE